MKHFVFARLLPWLLIALCPPLLDHCGGATEPGTETGNPPVVEQQRLHIVLRDTGVEVVGDAGAVSPGASVRVTNRASGASAQATARGDGSVSVVVPGSLQDEYEVTVSNGAGSQTVQVTTTTGTPIDAGAELANASCEALDSTLRMRVAAAYSEASTACQTDSDCTEGGDVGCYYTCGGPIVSVSGAAAARAAILQDTAPLCGELSQRCGPRGPPSCTPLATTTTIGCSNGSCQVLSCGDLGNRAGVRISDTLKYAPRECTTGADCSLLSPHVRCVADCGTLHYSVTSSAVSQLNQSVLLLQDPFCTEFESRGCPAPIQLPCVPPLQTPQATCNAGQCEVTYVPLP